MQETYYENAAQLHSDESRFRETTNPQAALELADAIARRAYRFQAAASERYLHLGIELAQQLQQPVYEADFRLRLIKLYYNAGVPKDAGDAQWELFLPFVSKHRILPSWIEGLQIYAAYQMARLRPDEAKRLLQEADALADELALTDSNRADEVRWIGKYYFATVAFHFSGDYAWVLRLAQDVLVQAVRLRKRDLELGALQLVALVSEKMDELDNAIQHIRQIVRVALQNNNQLDAVGAYAYLGRLYKKKKDFEAAQQAFETAEKHAEQFDPAMMWSVVYYAQISFLLEINELDKADQQIQRLQLMRDRLGKQVFVRQMHELQATLAIKQGRLAEGIELLEACRVELSATNMPVYELSNVLRQLHEAYAAMGDFGRAYHALQEFTTLSDQVFNEQKTKEFAQFRTQFEAEQRESELRLLKLQQTESELKALKSQMNPHFIFNALNSIQEMFFLGDKRLANKHLSQFSALMRRILHASSQTWISLEDELAMLRDYLELEAVRFGDEFAYTLELDHDIDLFEAEIPPMLLQPYVENAMKHGLLHREGQRRLDILLQPHEHLPALWVFIADNGIGRKASAEINARRQRLGKSFASGATQKRLELLLPEALRESAVQYDDLPVGTRVRLLVPLRDAMD